MNWTMVLLGFALAVLMGAALAALLAQNRGGWSRPKRVLVAASVLPAITLAATIAGVLFIKSSSHGAGREMEDLAVAAVLTLGGGFVLLAFLGGVVGAALQSRRR